MRLIDSGPGPGAWNLALDDAIFRRVREGASPPTLRFYAWAQPALSLGYAQDRDRDVDLGRCRALGLDVLRRATGGRAVLHDRELTYSVAVPASTPPFGSGLDAAYRAVAAGLVAGLRLLGIPAVAAPSGRGQPRERPHPGCFAAPARHEITVAGRKLVGSAQRRRAGAFLQHGSVLVGGHAAALGAVLRAPSPPDAGEAMVGLAELLDPCPSRGAVVAALARGCAAAWAVPLVPGAPSADELRLAGAIEAGRYRSEAWNAGPRARSSPALPPAR